MNVNPFVVIQCQLNSEIHCFLNGTVYTKRIYSADKINIGLCSFLEVWYRIRVVYAMLWKGNQLCSETIFFVFQCKL
ncbi:hypothetical protein D3C77_790190 [compost metagenome]